MKTIEKDELYEHLCEFLKAKGIEMKDGSYPKAVQKGCSFLADAINLSQKGITQAKSQIDKNLERMRQVIHEKTAPKAPPKTGGSPKSKVQSPKSKAQGPKAKGQRPKAKARQPKQKMAKGQAAGAA
jgi:hypothetical protein